MRLSGIAALLLFLVSASFPIPASAQSCVDINTASAERLQLIKHIGPQRAGQIIALRRQKRFASVNELTRVKGIAAKRLADIKQQRVACVQKKPTARMTELAQQFADAYVKANPR